MATFPGIADLVSSMTEAAKDSLGGDWPKARTYAKPEFARLAQSVVDIGELAATGEISAAEAKALLSIHKNTTRTIFLTVEGLGILAVEKAVNAALGSVKEAVNAAVGVALI
jgi:hypothetical protein